MAIKKYLRTDSDCCLLYKNEQFSNYGDCTALIHEVFEAYVFKGKCGTYECPFYKKSEDSIRIGEKEKRL